MRKSALAISLLLLTVETQGETVFSPSGELKGSCDARDTAHTEKNNECIDGNTLLQMRAKSGTAAMSTYETDKTTLKEERYPSQFFQCSHKQVPVSGKNDALYSLVAEEVKQQYKMKATVADKQGFAACVVRVAGHDLMDFRYDSTGAATGGSDGCINFEDDDNKGLVTCLKANGYPSMYGKFCDRVSLGDFFVIAAEVAMAVSVSHEGNGQQQPAIRGPTSAGWEAAFKSKFVFGRPTQSECEDHVGLMPDPEEGCYDLKRVFIDHVYLGRNKQISWARTAALSGVHTLGGTHSENSGYQGTWTSDPWVFNNAYYMRILDQGWMPERNVGNNPKKNMWVVSDETQTAAEQGQMMLNSDLCMIFDNSLDSVLCDRCILNHPKFLALEPGSEKDAVFGFCRNIRGRGHYLNAKEKMCCTWTRPDKMMIGSQWYDPENPFVPLPALYNPNRTDNHHCGDTFQEGTNAYHGRKCCRKVFDHPDSIAQGAYSTLDFCDYQGNIEGSAWLSIQEFAYDENAWHIAFMDAWKVATTNSINYVHHKNAKSKSARKFKSGQNNCGSCKYKIIKPGDEGFEESENLKKENTYEKAFWEKREKTWPMWTAEGDAGPGRVEIVSKLRAALKWKGLDTTWMDGDDAMGPDNCPR